VAPDRRRRERRRRRLGSAAKTLERGAGAMIDSAPASDLFGNPVQLADPDYRPPPEESYVTTELARARVLDFIGAPDAQMRLAARLWGHCCICGKALTDPISLEKGIGPDCLQAKIDFIRLNAASPVKWLVFYSGMPREFVVEVIGEQRAP
jgi:hypothetical protein